MGLYKIGKNKLGQFIKGNCFRKSRPLPYFKNWSDNMAYLLGYIATDGCLSSNPKVHGYELRFCVSEKDKDILEKIKKELTSKNKIRIYKRTQKRNFEKIITPIIRKEASLVINSKEAYYDLIKLGIYPRKSKTIKMLNIPSQHLAHFVRGIIDGDGCFGVAVTNDCSFVYLKIASASINFLNKLQNIINNSLGIFNKTKIVIDKNRVGMLNYYGKRAELVLGWVYKDTLLYLDRKYDKYKKLISGNHKKW